MITIVDYGMGNLESVKNAVFFLEKEALVTESASDIRAAGKIIFPGVGHFSRAVSELKKRGLFQLLRQRIKEGVPFLGICLGMQLLFEKSKEAEGKEGLGIIKGEVIKFSGKNLVVPHMGWNQIKKVQSPKSKVLSQDKNMDLFEGIEGGSYFYFAHSYYCCLEEDAALSFTRYGNDFVSSLHKDNVWAIQFHPEKSQDKGLKVLDNFLNFE